MLKAGDVTIKQPGYALSPVDVRALLNAAGTTGQNLYVDSKGTRSTKPARVIGVRGLHGQAILKVMHDDKEWALNPFYSLYIQ